MATISLAHGERIETIDYDCDNEWLVVECETCGETSLLCEIEDFGNHCPYCGSFIDLDKAIHDDTLVL